MNKKGKFVISLDFELFWGVRDKKTIESYGKNISGVHDVIPKLLTIFREFDVCATFSTVGFLFFERKSEIMENTPSLLPSYSKEVLSPYNGAFESVGDNYEEDVYHYAPNLIKLILENPEHEIGTHTFSHYYCLEEGQNVDQFYADIEKAKKIAQKYNLELSSLVFPRNQFNDEYLEACKSLGIICYRGNEISWLYKPKSGKQETKLRRGGRLLDAYINISGHNCYSDEFIKKNFPLNIPSSRFLRPYDRRLGLFDNIRLNRITKSMTYAAKNNLTYHLWWHPHNFGVDQEKNLSFLRKILEHYKKLNENYQFQSTTMSKLANVLLNEK